MTIDVEEIIRNLKKFDEAYYSGAPLIPDDQYDMLRRQAENIAPDHEYFKTSAHSTKTSLEKVELPYPMGSLNQVYEGDALKWAKKYKSEQDAMIVTEKLDGVSVLLIYEKKSQGKATLMKAYTRGDGLFGHDVTFHVKDLNIPKAIDCDYLAVRAEVIMSRSVFDSKYQKDYKNPRNLVAGFLNRKETNRVMLKDIDVVAYEVIDVSGVNNVFTKEETLLYLQKMGFTVARYLKLLGSELSDETLASSLGDFRKSGKYDLDGVVITINDYSKFKEQSNSGSLNPEHSVKFKVQTLFQEVEVAEVLWKLSKSNFFKPRIRFEPVELDGATITYATGHNAKFISDNGVGRGARIKVTRAGSVIPYVVEVVKPVSPDMPAEGTWKWDENKVEIVSTEEFSSQRTLMEIVHFLKTLGVENVQETSIKKLIEAQSWEDKTFDELSVAIIELWDEEWKRSLGENGKKAFISLHTNLSNLKPEILMGALPYFGRGFGVRKAKKLLEQMNFEQFKNATLEELQKLDGFNTTCESIYEGIPRFNEFLDKVADYITFSEKNSSDETMKGQVIVMTGFRDNKLKEKIENKGGKVTTSVSKNTTLVLAQNINSSSSKIKKARELGISVMNVSDFIIT